MIVLSIIASINNVIVKNNLAALDLAAIFPLKKARK